jgi:hypothetical protein
MRSWVVNVAQATETSIHASSKSTIARNEQYAYVPYDAPAVVVGAKAIAVPGIGGTWGRSPAIVAGVGRRRSESAAPCARRQPFDGTRRVRRRAGGEDAERRRRPTAVHRVSGR